MSKKISFIRRTNFTYYRKALILKKSYDNILVKVIIQLPQRLETNARRMAIEVLKDELFNLLNDTELANLLKIPKNTTGN